MLILDLQAIFTYIRMASRV